MLLGMDPAVPALLYTISLSGSHQRPPAQRHPQKQAQHQSWRPTASHIGFRPIPPPPPLWCSMRARSWPGAQTHRERPRWSWNRVIPGFLQSAPLTQRIASSVFVHFGTRMFEVSCKCYRQTDRLAIMMFCAELSSVLCLNQRHRTQS